jgi:hypothetical protein
MAGPEFHQTGYGRRFFEAQLPDLIRGINRLAEAIEESNELEKAKEPKTPADVAQEFVEGPSES